MAFVDQTDLSGNLGEPSVTARNTSGGTDVAIKSSYLIRPYDDLAAVAFINGVGVDFCVFAHIGTLGVADCGILALEAAAGIDLAAALAAHGFEFRIVDQADLFAGDLDLAAGLAGVHTRDIQGAAVVNYALLSAV